MLLILFTMHDFQCYILKWNTVKKKVFNLNEVKLKLNQNSSKLHSPECVLILTTTLKNILQAKLNERVRIVVLQECCEGNCLQSDE